MQSEPKLYFYVHKIRFPSDSATTKYQHKLVKNTSICRPQPSSQRLLQLARLFCEVFLDLDFTNFAVSVLERSNTNRKTLFPH